MEDQELLAAIGLVVVNAAAFDYAIAVLTATLESADTERVRDLASTSGKARKALTKIADANRDRLDIRMLSKAANELLDDRGILAHSIILTDTEYSGQPTYSSWNPKRDAEAPVTIEQLLEHAQAMRVNTGRAYDLIAAQKPGMASRTAR